MKSILTSHFPAPGRKSHGFATSSFEEWSSLQGQHILADMTRFIRMWYLLRILRKACQDGAPDADPSRFGTLERFYVSKSVFLSQVADRYFFGIKRSKKNKNIRMHKDQEILESAIKKDPPMADEIQANGVAILNDPNSFDYLIRTTGAGSDFADPINGFVEFCNKYKIMYAIIYSIAIATTAYSPVFRSFLWWIGTFIK